MKLRSMLNPEEQTNFVDGPTKFKKGVNKSELNCSVCGGTYYVDDVTFSQAMSGMCDGLDNPFCCEDCQSEYEELAH